MQAGDSSLCASCPGSARPHKPLTACSGRFRMEVHSSFLRSSQQGGFHGDPAERHRRSQRHDHGVLADHPHHGRNGPGPGYAEQAGHRLRVHLRFGPFHSRHARIPGCRASGQEGGCRGGRRFRGPAHRAAPRTGLQPVCEDALQFPLLLHPQVHVREVCHGLCGHARRHGDHRRTVRGLRAGPDRTHPALPHHPL